MELFSPKETCEGESRAALVPECVKKLTSLGLSVNIESGLGDASDYINNEYTDAGATQVKDRSQALGTADIILRVRQSTLEEVSQMKSGALHISFFDPFAEQELLKSMAAKGISVISMEMIPRTTIAQKMDALSSQSNLAGYYAVIKAAERIKKILPMMITPAGTLSSARVFIVGVGVAGLQAIATAKRLGARVEAFDTRPNVEEEIKSLGAKFLNIDLGETGQTDQGYAKSLTPEQLALQREKLANICAQSDIVITAARVFGKKAPVIITKEMIAKMNHGSVLVDQAVASGGNIEGSKIDEEIVTESGARIIGIGSLEGCVAHDASQVYASNLTSLIEHFWNDDKKCIDLNLKDDILKSCLLAHGGQIIHEDLKDIN